MKSEERAREQHGAEPVFAAWALRVENGEKLELESLIREHPTLEAELRALHEDWKLFAPLLGKAVPGLIASAEGLVSPSLSGPDVDEGAPTDELYARLGIRIPDEGRYRFRAVIGRGGGGVVLKVWDSKLSRPLAMKIILGPSEDRPTGQTPKVDSRTLSRFVDEARIASQLNHPGIVPVHELGADESGRAFFTMKLVKGDDLSKIFEKVRGGVDGWNESRALAVLLRVCEAMAYAHDKGVIHRDLKPANIMVGSYEEVHVMDWGLARVVGEKDRRDLRIQPPPRGAASVVGSVRRRDLDASTDSSLLTTDGTFMGTPSYMAPEQAKGEIEKVGALADVYAVGATLYDLIAGEPPYYSRAQRLCPEDIRMSVVRGPPRRAEELAPRTAPELVAICEKAMAREPSDRYASMRDLAADLRAFLEGRVVAAYETGAWAETRKWVRRNRTLAAAVAALFLVLTAGLTSMLVTTSRLNRRTGELVEAKRIAQGNEALAKSNAYFATVIGAEAARARGEPANVRRLLDSTTAELRNWEWRYLDAVSNTSLMKLEGHGGVVNCVAFSQDGKRIVTASRDKTARVWDVDTGRELQRLSGHAESVVSASFGPDGTQVITVSEDRTARIWNVHTGDEQKRIYINDNGVLSVWIGSDGVQILSASVVASADGSIFSFATRTFDPATCNERSLNRHTVRLGFQEGTACAVAVNDQVVSTYEYGRRARYSIVMMYPEPRPVAAIAVDGVVHIFDTTNCVEVAKLYTDVDRFLAIADTPNYFPLVTTGFSGDVRLWDRYDGSEIARLEGHTEAVTCAAISGDGTRIATGSADNTVRIWDAGIAHERRRTIIEMRTQARSASFSPDGAQIVTWSWSDRMVSVWNTVSGGLAMSLAGHADLTNAAEFSPDGARIVTASDDGTGRVWDSTIGRQLALLKGHRDAVNAARFSPDGALIVTASDDKTGRVWDAATGQPLFVLVGHTDIVNTAAFCLGGRRIVTASDDGTARLWDSANGVLVGTLQTQSREAAAECNTAGTRIVTRSGDVAEVWDAASGQRVAVLEGHTSAISSVAFSRDGMRIVTASLDGTARVWNAANGERIALLTGHASDLTSAAFSPDGTRIVTSSSDRTARVWDTVSGQQVALLRGHTGSLPLAAFSFDGVRIVTVGEDYTLREWDAVPYPVRFAQDEERHRSAPEGRRALDRTLAETRDWGVAADRLRIDRTTPDLVRKAALNLLTVRSNKALVGSRDLIRKRLERVWQLRMLGREPWPSEADLEATLPQATASWSDADVLNDDAWTLVDPDEPLPGEEMRAMFLARRAVALDPNPTHRDTLARALYRLGRFDDAIDEQRKALEGANEADKKEYHELLDRLITDIASWRDEAGNIRNEEWKGKLEALDAEIAILEADPDVQLWLASESGRGPAPENSNK